MADRNTQIKGSQIVDAIAGSGMRKGNDENLYIGVDGSTLQIDIGNDWIEVKDGGITDAKLASDYIQTSEVDDSTIEFAGSTLNIKSGGVTETELNTSVAGDGLAGGGGSALSVNVDDSTIEISADTLQLKDSGVTPSKLDTFDSPAGGEILSYNGVSGQMEWKSIDSLGVGESDFKLEDLTSLCDGSKANFSLATTPVGNSIQVFLNGLMQQKGVGEDYEISGSQAIQFAAAPESDDIVVVHYVEQD